MIYLDVTRLLTWQGNYTGMERFAFEITKELSKKDNISPCCYLPGKGFVSLEGDYHIQEGRLTSSVLDSSPGLRHLAKNNKKSFAKELINRKILNGKHKAFKTIPPLSTLLVFDGLWDREGYIESLIQQARKGTRIAHVIHDLVPVVMPHVCYDFVSLAFKNYFSKITPYIDVLFSISKNTEKDFKCIFGGLIKTDASLVVIRHGDDFGGASQIKPDFIKDEKYILAVGTLEVRKNYQLLYQAYRLAEEKRKKLPKLVIVGREGWMAEASIYAFQIDPIIKEKVLLAGPINDNELAWLYANCLFTVFPSVYEGWGLPVSESLYYGKVCAASNASSIPEIGEELNLYYSPYNVEECLDILTRLLDNKLRNKLEITVKEKYRSQEWKTTAANIQKSLL